MKTVKIIIKIILCTATFVGLLILFLISEYIFFGSDYGVTLPKGYSLVRIYGGAVLLFRPTSGICIDANIDGYKVLEREIVGHVSCDGLPPDSYEITACKSGFFIVEMQTGGVQKGLDEQQWMDSLRKLGLTKKPELRAPSRFDRYRD